MGFKDMFKKKPCSICGYESNVLSNKKLADGNLCTNCDSKLSHYYCGRKNASVEQIRKHLQYREKNREQVLKMKVTRILGDYHRLLIDEDQGVFTVCINNDPTAGNPDVISFSQVTGCYIDVSHSSVEEKNYSSNGSVSYNPPRYNNYYRFFIEIHLNHPEISVMRFPIQKGDILIPGSLGNPELNAKYCKYKELCEEIKDYLLSQRQQQRDRQLAAAAPKQAVNCPFCCATTTPTSSGCCEYCGSALAK